MGKRKLSRTENHEQNLQRFVNNYKWKTKEEIIASTMEIKSSDISEFESRLLDGIRDGVHKRSIGLLASIQIVLSRLIGVDCEAKEFLTERLRIVEDAIEKN